MNPNNEINTHSNLTVAVMAGGKSSRMGSDKSFMPLHGKPMIEHVLAKIDGMGSETIIISNDTERYDFLDYSIYSDIYTDFGPLGGLHAALTYAANQYILVVACDMPWLNRSLLEYMISLRMNYDVVVPRWTKFPEPMHAVYSKDCVKHVEHNLDSGLLKLISFYGQVSVRYINRDVIELYDPEGLSFENVNTPDDLSRAKNRKKPG